MTPALFRVLVALWALAAFAQSAAAAQPGHMPAMQTVFTGQASCPAWAGEPKETTLRRCFAAARIDLLDKAGRELERLNKKLYPDLSQADYRAVAAGLLTPETDGRDYVQSPEGAVASIKLKAATDPDKMAAKVAEVAANPDLRRRLVASQQEAEAKDKKAVSAGPSKPVPAKPGQSASAPGEEYADFSKADAERRKIMGKMNVTAEIAGAEIRQGMNNDQVRKVLGEPLTVKLGTVVGNFICLGYGEVWVVLENGLASCLRRRLEYSRAYDSDCHCAGLKTSFVPFATDPQTEKMTPKGPRDADQTPKRP